MNKDETRQLLAMIAATWPKFAYNKQTIIAWESPLRECDFEDCKAAIKRYQNPRNEEEARRCAFAPHPGDIYAICKTLTEERVAITTEVRSCARRAISRFPSKGEDEQKEAFDLFCRKCFAEDNPARAARILESELDAVREIAESENKMDKLKTITMVIRGFRFDQ